MKIRKFNESSSKEIDTEYVRHCFADFIDRGRARIEEGESAAYGRWIDLAIEFDRDKGLPKYNDDLQRSRRSGSEWVANESNSAARFAEELEEKAAAMREVESCIARLADEYPDYSFKIWSHVFSKGEFFITSTNAPVKTGIMMKIWP